MVNTKVEELLSIINWIERLMLKTVLVASNVANPDIVSSVSRDKGRSLISIVNHKSVRRVLNTVLE